MWDVFSQIRSFKKNYQLTKKRRECDQRIELAHPLVGDISSSSRYLSYISFSSSSIVLFARGHILKRY